MKTIKRLFIVLALAAMTSLPAVIHLSGSANFTQQIADGGGPIPPWPPN